MYEAATRVGQQHGLPEDWLNDAVKGFLLGEDPAASVLFDHPGQFLLEELRDAGLLQPDGGD